MTVDEIRARVASIANMEGDPEMAHGAEDRLHQDVLSAIADGEPNAADLAREALLTLRLDFPRWCA